MDFKEDIDNLQYQFQTVDEGVISPENNSNANTSVVDFWKK